MMNENIRRNMEFIVEQQARFAARLERLEEERIRDQPRQAELQKSFQTVVELMRIQESRIDRSESRMDRTEFDSTAIARRTSAIETNMAALAAAQAHADERLSALINIVMEDRGRSS
jgi:DNA repair exonuclease SbcCD ATPase subunit